MSLKPIQRKVERYEPMHAWANRVLRIDLSNMRVETTDLSERDIPAVQIGQTANVFIDALDDNFSGKVVDIDRQSETVGGDVTYKVTIDLDQQPAGLRWGMSAEVEIQTEQ